MIEHRVTAEARAFTPGNSPAESIAPGGGSYGTLAESSMGDWSWKPWKYSDGDGRGSFRFLVTGPRCTCTLSAPVGTSCARHN